MKILAVLSGLDFKNSVRRATLEAIWRQNRDTDFLFYTGLKNAHKKKKTINGPNFYSYHFWVPEAHKNHKLLTELEYNLRGRRWSKFFDRYDTVFLMDPNQYYLLEYVKNQKVVYLLRDPNILLSDKNYEKEKKILQRCDMILAISEELKNHYLPIYYGSLTKVMHWPNSVDLQNWDIEKYNRTKKYEKTTVGVSGNLTFKTDLRLLDQITTKLQNLNFILIGKNKLESDMRELFEDIAAKKNVFYRGLLPLEKVPEEIVKWHIGLMIERNDIEFSRYFNANKIYQYLAMGLPCVKYRYNNELSNYSDVIFEVNGSGDFINALETALEKSGDRQFQRECIVVAKENSADRRAEDFLEWVKDL